jgi:radical SAM protein with 4Fe4S-binding SPASM domain
MECAAKQNNDLGFIRDFNKKSEKLRIPISGSIDLTDRCNLRCIHCYLRQTSDPQGSGVYEMNTRKILSLIDEITGAGCLYFLITGGEPLLRKDFPEIYSHAKKNGLILTVFTNGTLLTDRVIDLFGDLPPRVVEISLYGATAATYEEIAGVPGTYEKCLKAVRRLLERKISVGLKTILMTANRHEFKDIEAIAREFGVKFRFDAAIFPCLNGDRSPLMLRVPPEEAVEKEFSDKSRARKWGDFFERTHGQLPDNDSLYNCGAGITNFHIDARGNLKPCMMISDMTFDLLHGSFLQGWHGIIAGIRQKKAGNASACNRCEKRHLCGFCPAFSKLENGAEDHYSQYLCSVGSFRFMQVKNYNGQGVENGT